MAGVEFKPILEPDLPEVAAFLHAQQEIESTTDSTQARPDSNDLRGFVHNPHLSPGASLGETIRGAEGNILGMILAVPRQYRIGSRRVLGLAAGNFYVSASARMQGFFMLRRFLNTPGFDFVYANSCNRQSGALWAKCGGMMVPESDVEYLLPINLGPLAEEWAIRKEWPRGAARALRVAGAPASLITRLRLPANRLKLEYCVDFTRLAEIAERCVNPKFLQAERSVAYLKWVYGGLPSSLQLKDNERAIFRFANPSGGEGWFALFFSRRGRNGQIRAARLLDVVWPHEQMAFADVLPALVAVAKNEFDLLSIRGRVGLGLRDGWLGLRQRSLIAPEGYLFSRVPPTGDLINLADFPFADRY